MPVLWLILFCIAFVGLGAVGVNQRRDFYLAGRSAGSLTVAGSLAATALGASSTIGLVGEAWSHGWIAFWWLGAGVIGMILLALFWVRPLRASGESWTLPDWAGRIYGAPARKIAAGIIVLMWVSVIAAQWVAAGALIHFITGWPAPAGIVIAAGVVTLYTAIGGQFSVLRTDVVQMGFIGIALGAAGWAAGHLLHQTHAWNAVPSLTTLFPHNRGRAVQWLALLYVVGGTYVMGPDMASRVFAARDDRAAKRGAFIAAATLLACAGLLCFTGIAAHAGGIPVHHPRNVFPALINDGFLPNPVAHLAMFGLLAALFSSADTCILTAASVFSLDLLDRPPDRKHVGFTRLLIVILAAYSVVLAAYSPRIIPNLMLAYSFYAGGLLPPLLLAGFPALLRRVPHGAVWTAMIVGGFAPVLSILLGASRSMVVAGAQGSVSALLILLLGIRLQNRAHPTRGPWWRP